ncbi:MAG: hypothetical protein ACIAQF_03345 [Phycisphaerales bacterium JB065]
MFLVVLSLLSLSAITPGVSPDSQAIETRDELASFSASPAALLQRAGEPIPSNAELVARERESKAWFTARMQGIQRGSDDCAVGSIWLHQFEDIVALSSSPDYNPTRFVYIDASAPVGGDGTSWNAAFQSLQDALENAEFNYDSEIVEFRVAGGVYRADRVNGVDTLDPDLSIELPGLTWNGTRFVGVKSLKGGYAGRGAKNPDERNIDLYPTLFTGDLLGDDTEDYENYADNTKILFLPNQTELNGITIEHARIAAYEARWMTDCTVRWCFADSSIPVAESTASPVYALNARVVGCSFDRNRGDRFGGALKPEGFVVVANSRFTRNCAPTGGAIGSRYSFGDDGATLIVQNCYFGENAADSAQGGSGGAVANFRIAPERSQFVHCTFAGNRAVDGGGMLRSVHRVR